MEMYSFVPPSKKGFIPFNKLHPTKNKTKRKEYRRGILKLDKAGWVKSLLVLRFYYFHMFTRVLQLGHDLEIVQLIMWNLALTYGNYWETVNANLSQQAKLKSETSVSNEVQQIYLKWLKNETLLEKCIV